MLIDRALAEAGDNGLTVLGIEAKAQTSFEKMVSTSAIRNWLKENAYSELVICGITTNHCCETTARMAGNLGYKVKFVLDATRILDFKNISGNLVKADAVFQMTATNLNGEFAEVVKTSDISL